MTQELHIVKDVPVYRSHQSPALKGVAPIPGDKSMSHRSVMFGLLAEGTTTIDGLLEGEDVLSTAEAARKLGATVTKDQDTGRWTVTGMGGKVLNEPDSVIDMGNSGTSVRLLMGLIGAYPITTFFEGDASLTKRPMQRVMTPLSQMGIQFMSREGGRLPLAMQGTDDLRAIDYTLPVASAQVKSAILLAGLRAKGQTVVRENKPTRDHTENMLRHFGCTVDVREEDGTTIVTLPGQQNLKAAHVNVPSDPSSAAFPMAAACLIEGSDITMTNIGMNDKRTGFIQTLIDMGADITIENEGIEAGEPAADLRIRGIGPLKGINVPEARVPSMIDEFPILSMVAACAEGTTTMTGLEELRVKESDRLAMVARGLEACGVSLEEGKDSLTIHGHGKPPKGGALIETALDHRIAMSFLVLGFVSDEPIQLDDGSPIATSFPSFVDLMTSLGAKITIE